MNSWFDPGSYSVGVAPAAGFERWLQERVATAFTEHPEYIDRSWETVQGLIFSGGDLDRMRATVMRIGCLFLDASEWRPQVRVTVDGELVFYRLEMSGPYETGRFRDGEALPPRRPLLRRFRRR